MFQLLFFAFLLSSGGAWIPNQLISRPEHLTNARESRLRAERDGVVRERRKMRLDRNGREVALYSRVVEVTSEMRVTVWEIDEPAEAMEAYWKAQQDRISLSFGNDDRLLDPFGLVSWPGSSVAAKEMARDPTLVQNRTVLCLGAGVGVEALTAALLGAARVIATDVNPTTLQQLRFGAEHAGVADVIETRILDVCRHSQEPLPTCDVLLVADVLYNEELANHIALRCVEAVREIPGVSILVTDSQRFTNFPAILNRQMEENGIDANAQWEMKKLHQFTGSGVMVNDDQTYDVDVRIGRIGKT